jgi:cellulose synthase/poly-beta-1,6-N-acetylglucosamine synthase-like glycosyltransferase
VIVVGDILLGVYALIILLMTLQSVLSLRMQLFIWEEPDRSWMNRSPSKYIAPETSFTVLLPARHEEAVIADTIDKICRVNYPKSLLQVLVICEVSDIQTIEKVRERLAQPGAEHVQLIIFADGPINKPHGLNKGLQAADKDVVMVFDAEDEPHEDIFNIVNTTIVTEDADVVQGGVYLMNYDTHWFSALNVLEYYFWFKSSLHYFSRSGLVPLGGNTVFVRRRVLRRLGGWDENCLTEDADLGIRLSASGARIRILCDDEHVTREETPHSARQLVKQRTRWHQGFFQVLLKGNWKRLPTRTQRMLAAYILSGPFIQAAFAVMLPISLAMMFLVKLPVLLAMFTFLPLYMFGLQLCLDLVGLAEFVRAQQRTLSWGTPARIIIGFAPYQWLLAFSAFRAIVRQMRKQTNWEKTAHVGAHRKVGNVA